MDSPSGGAPEQAPRWDLVDTKSCGGGIRVLAPYLIVWGYVGIYRRKEYVDGATGGPRGWRARLGAGVGTPPCLVASTVVSGCPLQVSWNTFVEKIMFPKVSFRLESV